jgi:hypothetical protein
MSINTSSIIKRNEHNSIALVFIVTFLGLTAFGQPYFDTHIKNKIVNQNLFLSMTVDTTIPPAFNTIKEQLPQLFWISRPDVVKCFWKTWKID